MTDRNKRRLAILAVSTVQILLIIYNFDTRQAVVWDDSVLVLGFIMYAIIRSSWRKKT